MKPDHTPNNYEKWCIEWSRRFLTLDQGALLRKIPGLTEDGTYLTLRYFGQRYGVHRQTGEIHALDQSKTPGISTRLNLYTLFWYCQDHASFRSEWLPFRDLKDASPFGPAFQRTVIEVFARTFSGHLEELHAACQSLGGLRLPHSDAGYQIPALECIPLQFLFWDGDDEFPAQANILFDKGSVEFNHVESLVTIASDGLSFLSEAAGLPLIEHTFT